MKRAVVAIGVAGVVTAIALASWSRSGQGLLRIAGGQREPRGASLASATLVPKGEIGLAEPSGIAYHAALDRLFVVGDRGGVAELDSDGHRLRVEAIKGDLEDVVVHEPTGELLLLSERRAHIVRFDPRRFAVVGRCRVDRAGLVAGAEHRRRHGFEGIAFRPDARLPGGGVISLAHQADPAEIVNLAFDPAACGTLEIGAAHVRSRWELAGRGTITGLCWVPRLERYLVIDGHRRRLLVVGADGVLEGWLRLPGVQPEGLCLDGRGTLWVADDRRGLWRCPGELEVLASGVRADSDRPAFTFP